MPSLLLFYLNNPYFVHLLYIEYKSLFVPLRTMTNEQKRDYTFKEEQIARFAKALSHPARIAILHFLAIQETCYFGDIHEELPIAKATVSQHLKELKEAGLIQGEIEAPKVKYCINKVNLQMAQELFSKFFGLCIVAKSKCC